jgi:DNA-binding IclR family transcriptional regulator
MRSTIDSDFAVVGPANDEISVLGRGVAVLQCIAESRGPVSNRDIAAQTGIPKPTVSRITSTLVSQGFLHQYTDSERFALTATVLSLSNGFLKNFSIRSRIKPHLETLAEQTGATIHITVRDRLHMVVIDVIKPASALFVSRFDVGTRLGIGVSAIGRGYMAMLPDEERRRALESLAEDNPENWPQMREVLDREFGKFWRQGYIVGTGDWNPLIGAVSVPLVGPGGERLGINCSGPLAIFSRERMNSEVAPKLVECVRRIAEEIGGFAYAPPSADVPADSSANVSAGLSSNDSTNSSSSSSSN